MKILTAKKQREIEKNRNAIFKYISSNVNDDVKEMGNAVEALANIAFDCGINNMPPIGR